MILQVEGLQILEHLNAVVVAPGAAPISNVINAPEVGDEAALGALNTFFLLDQRLLTVALGVDLLGFKHDLLKSSHK